MQPRNKETFHGFVTVCSLDFLWLQKGLFLIKDVYDCFIVYYLSWHFLVFIQIYSTKRLKYTDRKHIQHLSNTRKQHTSQVWEWTKQMKIWNWKLDTAFLWNTWGLRYPSFAEIKLYASFFFTNLLLLCYIRAEYTNWALSYWMSYLWPENERYFFLLFPFSLSVSKSYS